jgi:hypothetical protein
LFKRKKRRKLREMKRKDKRKVRRTWGVIPLMRMMMMVTTWNSK